MKIKNIKKKCLVAGILLILAGSMIGIVGLGIEGFQLEHFAETGKHKWYRTFNIGNDSGWIGLKGKNGTYYFTIGTAE